MALIINEAASERLPEAVLAAWRGIPPAIISDELNRTGAMAAAIKPLAPGMTCLGQALTVQCMVGDNGPLHYAVTKAWPGAVLVADARGHTDTAVWGGILTLAAKHAGIVGVIIDGAVRDVAELRPIGARRVRPGGGAARAAQGIWRRDQRAIQCGGVAVNPGDMVVGDDDGVVVVKPGQLPGLLERCRARLEKEKMIVRELAAGKTTVELTGLPPAREIG